jgi:hypothetical protein
MPKPACVHACLAREGRRSAKGAASSPLLDARTTTCPSARVPTLPTTTARCRPQTHATNPPPHTADHHRIRRQSRTPREPPHHTCEVLRTTRRGAHPFVDAHTTSHTHPEAPPSLTVPVPARAPQWAARLHPPGLAQPAHAARWAARLPIPALPNRCQHTCTRSAVGGAAAHPSLAQPAFTAQWAARLPLPAWPTLRIASGCYLSACPRPPAYELPALPALRRLAAGSGAAGTCVVPPPALLPSPACAGLCRPVRPEPRFCSAASAAVPLLRPYCCISVAAPAKAAPPLLCSCCRAAAAFPSLSLPCHGCRSAALATSERGGGVPRAVWLLDLEPTARYALLTPVEPVGPC